MVNTEQIFQEKVLEVKHLGTKMAKENVEKLRSKESLYVNQNTGNVYQSDTIQNQSGRSFDQNKNINEHNERFTAPSITPCQHISIFNQHRMTNLIRPDNFANNVQNFDARFQNPLNQQHMNYSLQQRYQQPGLMEEGQRSYRAATRSVHSYTSDPGNALYGLGLSGLPETTINSQRQSNDQQGLPTEPENLKSNDGGSHSNELVDLQDKMVELSLNKPTEAPQRETVTTPQPPRNGQEEWINIPNNQPQLNQQQTIPNQQTTTLQGNLNFEPSPKNSSASKPSIKPRKVTERTEHSKDSKIPKITPTPPPRQNKQATSKSRKNAAYFSNTPVKATQTGQKNLAPNEPHTNSVKDDVNATTKLNQKGEQRSSPQTESDKNSVKDNVNTTTKQNLEAGEQRSSPATKSDNNSVKDNVNTTTKPNLEGEQRSSPLTESDNNSVKDNVNITTKQNLEGEQRSSPLTESDNNSVKDNVNTTTKPNLEGEQRSTNWMNSWTKFLRKKYI